VSRVVAMWGDSSFALMSCDRVFLGIKDPTRLS
jgi:hypothetical protein